MLSVIKLNALSLDKKAIINKSILHLRGLKKYSLATLLTCISLSTFSQKLEVGGGLGAHFYKGDLNPNFNPLLARPAGHAMVRYNFSRAFSLKASGAYGFLEGNDALSTNPFNKQRDYQFKSQLTHWEAELEFNFLNFRSSGTIVKSSWTPIISIGLGQFGISGRKFYEASTLVKTLEPIAFPDLAITYGFGFKKEISSYWNISANFKAVLPSLRKKNQRSNLDLYDGLGYKADPATSLFSPINEYSSNTTLPIFTTPNTHQKDIFYHGSITLSYVFKTVKCPNPKK